MLAMQLDRRAGDRIIDTGSVLVNIKIAIFTEFRAFLYGTMSWRFGGHNDFSTVEYAFVTQWQKISSKYFCGDRFHISREGRRDFRAKAVFKVERSPIRKEKLR